MSRGRPISVDRELSRVNLQLQGLGLREAELHRLVEEFQKMKETVTNERLVLEARRYELESIKSPISWLPPELLIQIFLAFTAIPNNHVSYRTPVIVSHVSRKWRTISLYTPALWSRVILEGYRNANAALTFFTRSQMTPLELEYHCPLSSEPSDECDQMVAFSLDCQQVLPRLEHLTLESRTVKALGFLGEALRTHAISFPKLQRLSISILSPNPHFASVPKLIPDSMVRGLEDKLSETSQQSQLAHLRIQEFPIFNFPRPLVTNLRTLELAYSPRKRLGDRFDYYLRMSALCQFLSATPLLEELTLLNTVPYFDVTLPSTNPTVDPALIQMQAVKLDHLKFIDWSFPFPYDVHRFLSMLDIPGLEKLDIWVEDFPSKRVDTTFVRGYNTSMPSRYTNNILDYHSLRDLNMQCVTDDSMTYTFRKLTFPVLQSASFTCVDEKARKHSQDGPSLITFPRLESIFRDPRLFHLTHLSLSYYMISQDDHRVESMLGYLPVLTTLSLDSCLGIGRLLEVLQEKVVHGIMVHPSQPGAALQPRRGVKVCPRLEALSFWGCQDLGDEGLRKVLLSRCKTSDGSDESSAEPVRVQEPNGDSPPVTNNQLDEKVTVENVTATPLGRKIKPLRKSRRPPPATAHAASTSENGFAPPSRIVSSMIAMQESLQPAQIIYLRISDCKLISHEQASSLSQLGVVDVIWTTSDGKAKAN